MLESCLPSGKVRCDVMRSEIVLAPCLPDEWKLDN